MANINGNLSQFPPSGDYTRWQDIADHALGVSAQLTGGPFSIYRCSVSGDYVQIANQVFTQYPIFAQQYSGGKINGLDTDKGQGAYWYGIQTDVAPLLVGDIMVSTDATYGAGSTLPTFSTDQVVAMALASHPYGKVSIAARIDRYIKVYRPAPAPTGTYWSTTLDTALPLVCTAGVWGFGLVTDVPSIIPAGFMPEKRARGRIYDDVGDQPPKTMQKIYVPLLNGFRFSSNDIIVSCGANEGDRYRVQNPWFQDAGVLGFQLLCERTVENV